MVALQMLGRHSTALGLRRSWVCLPLVTAAVLLAAALSCWRCAFVAGDAAAAARRGRRGSGAAVARRGMGDLPIELLTLPSLDTYTSKGVIPAPRLELPDGERSFFDPSIPLKQTGTEGFGPPELGEMSSQFVTRVFADFQPIDGLITLFMFCAIALGFLDTRRRWFTYMSEFLAWALYEQLSVGPMPQRRVTSTVSDVERSRASWSETRQLGAFLEVCQPEDREAAAKALIRAAAGDERLQGLAVALQQADVPGQSGGSSGSTAGVETDVSSSRAANLLASAMAEMERQLRASGADVASRERVARAWDLAAPDDGGNYWSRLTRRWDDTGIELRRVLGLTCDRMVPEQLRTIAAVTTAVLLGVVCAVSARSISIGLGSPTDAVTWSFFGLSYALVLDYSVKARRESLMDLLRSPEDRLLRQRVLTGLCRWADSGALRRRGTAQRDEVLLAVRKAVPELRIDGALPDGEVEDLLKVWHPALRRKTERGLSRGGKVRILYDNLSVNPQNVGRNIW
mmetsp:Transcript_11269/g.30159  ORF Transcript_11269/g.30159 Transcript_11269/m.30159 type:complete len:514 (-) Transcript_11269:94-1635(-)